MSPAAPFDPRSADAAMAALRGDSRVVLVLDAGGTSFRFDAMQGDRSLLDAPHTLPSLGDDLERSLAQLTEGFATVHAATGRQAVALSLAFPGPADYRRGIIGDLPNLPGYRGGVPLGPMLAARFGLPVFLGNDGALFTYGEALGGLLPEVNAQLAAAGSTRRFRNLLGVTIGTGFGGGIVIDGRLVVGDNSAAGQIWTMRQRDDWQHTAEERVSIRGVQVHYALETWHGGDHRRAPALEPREIARIANGEAPGNRQAAVNAFRRLGQVAGDAIAGAVALIDGLVVVGGGLSGAAPLFLGALLAELNGTLDTEAGPVDRLAFQVVDLEEPSGIAALALAPAGELVVSGTALTVPAAPRRMSGVGVTRLGTTAAIALGAYAHALAELGDATTPR
jgi:glucokinase